MNVKLRPLKELCEEWKEFDENYLIGDDGNIYRRLRSGYYRHGKHPYQQVRGKFGTEKQHTVHLHKACGLAFCIRPTNATDIDHIDNDKTNNSADNLRWVTHRENIIKRWADARRQNNG